MDGIVPINLMAQKAEEAEGILGILANRRRLIILCNLMVHGELSVGDLISRLDLAQSALSQHLALMRAAGVVTTRRSGTTIYYSISDPRVIALLDAIKTILCPPECELDAPERELESLPS